jgi:hypothetical protein
MARRLLAATPMSTRAGPSTDRCSRKVRLDAADNRTRSCCYAAYGLRTRRRRSRDRPSLVSPPQMPCLIEFASAYSRHWARTGHRVHTAAAFASRMSRSCGLSPSRPKNSSASLPTQAALSCQLTPQHSRPATSAHLGPLRREPPPSPFCAARNLSIQAAAYAAPGAKVPRPGPRRQSLRPGRVFDPVGRAVGGLTDDDHETPYRKDRPVIPALPAHDFRRFHMARLPAADTSREGHSSRYRGR